MIYQPVIRKVITGFLLLLFAFSVTPKKLLHDIFANHSDPVSGHSKSISFQLNSTAISCKCDNIFAQPVFILAEQILKLNPTFKFQELECVLLNNFSSTTVYFFERRGPPPSSLLL